MTDFTKILDKAKEIESKMKESQEKIKNIQVEGSSGSNSVKIILNGENEMIKITLSDEVLKEDKIIIEDLILAAHNNAKSELKTNQKFIDGQLENTPVLIIVILSENIIDFKFLQL